MVMQQVRAARAVAISACGSPARFLVINFVAGALGLTVWLVVAQWTS
jgi:hypothetical protein